MLYWLVDSYWQSQSFSHSVGWSEGAWPWRCRHYSSSKFH